MSDLSENKSYLLKPIKWYKQLASIKGRIENKAFLMEGCRAIRQIINNNPDDVQEIVYTDELPETCRPYLSRRVTEKQFGSICTTRTPQGIAAVVRLPAESYSDRLPDLHGGKILLLEHVQDPGNVGTLIRNAVAFNFSGVILSDKCADPFSPKCVQATAGTVLSLWLRRTSNYLDLVDRLKKLGFVIIATDIQGTEQLSILHKIEKLVLALGNEASGLSHEILQRADHILRIPIRDDRVESLNVAACGAICMFISDRSEA